MTGPRLSANFGMICTLLLLFSVAISRAEQSGAWISSKNVTQGGLYSLDGNCFLLTEVGFAVGDVLIQAEGERQLSVTVSETEFAELNGLAIYRVSPSSECSGYAWFGSLEAKQVFTRDLFDVPTELTMVENGALVNVSARVSSVGETEFCLSSDILQRGSVIGGAAVKINDLLVGFAMNWGRCEAGGLGYKVRRIDSLEQNLVDVSLAVDRGGISSRDTYRNGYYTGPTQNGVPHGSDGKFEFEFGEDSILFPNGDEWSLVSTFREGEPHGTATLSGPPAEDGKPQKCDLMIEEGVVLTGQCDVYFDSFLSPLGIDPRILRDVSDGFPTLKDLADLDMIECANPPACTEFAGGEMGMKGRYHGDVRGGGFSFFDPSQRLITGQLTEEYLVPHGNGTLLDVGSATKCWLQCDHVSLDGSNIYEGGWLDGSLTGQASITMNHGAKLTGLFELNYLINGQAENATANMVGMAYNMGYDVYSGPIKDGFEHGPDGRKTNHLTHSRIVGEFKEGFPWNATGAWTQDGVRSRCEWKEGDCTP